MPRLPQIPTMPEGGPRKMSDVIWSCPVCEADLEDYEDVFWCPECEQWFTPVQVHGNAED